MSGDSGQSGPVQSPQDPAGGTDAGTAPATTTEATPQHSVRRYLELKPLEKLDLPYHNLYENAPSDHRVTLAQFLNNLFTEVEQVDFDKDVKECGTWTPEGGNIMMPPLDAAENSGAIPVPVSVKKRIKTVYQGRWLARTSFHSDEHVAFSELGHLLAQDHSRNEVVYTPSVLDSVELLTWEREDLLKALGDSKYRHEIHNMQMSIFQMFHMMPKVAGREFLQDRVFHVLVVTTQTKHAESPGELARTFTVQLPVDFESFGNGIMAQRSHVKKIGSSRTYQVPQGQESCSFKPDVQRSRQGRKLTEGKYVAFERLTGAPKKPPSDTGNTGHHRWDMMTVGAAGGVTRIAPKSVQEKETMVEIAKDVEYVFTYIAEQRRKKSG
ncbi:uncharacterized protein SETTUDRAFT_100252 [Exserohilum turcica Et28A]|uniref:DUF3074 domain-containing protein n=1 Tax=Exserohilum turcicum (strain 28A) TaxID=671987 RepID=R0I5E5_EXST2|nr:uncharacterized protein SETTUDRAFT_100252 [Exserohilum turcica Et28A]EOA80801.1 hypothetical protein SETTUDRAFT_100252 [Exserohilum turcica Et28A]